jgi:cyclic pyranopterin phosphate synthase
MLGARISLNYSQFCNFACVFCHKEGNNVAFGVNTESGIAKAHTEMLKQQVLMNAEEIIRVSKIFSGVGIVRFKLTGGEPMLRPDIVKIVEGIGRLSPRDFGMTTNATRLYAVADQLKEAGLQRVNISLHSLDREKFKRITGVDRLKEVLKAVERSVEVGLTPVKLNCVLLRDVNLEEVNDFIDFASSFGREKVDLQLIELVNEGSASESGFFERYFYSLSQVESQLKSSAVKSYVRPLQHRPRYLVAKGIWVELVRPSHNSDFCLNNDRIRVTPDGKFKPCLLRDDNLVDFLTPLRKGASDAEILNLLFLANQNREPYYKTAHAVCAREETAPFTA